MSAEIDCKELVDRFVKQNGHVPEIQFIMREECGVDINEIDGYGLMNYMIRVQSKDGLHSVILKHGRGYAQHMPQLKFSLGRQVIEYNSLELMDRIIPGSVPKPYCYDNKNHIICMEDMWEFVILGDDLIKGEINLETASNIGKILAKVHQATSKKEVTKMEWQELETLLADRENAERMHEIQYSLMFQEDGPLVTLPESVVPTYRNNVSTLLSNHINEKLKEKMELRECFIHGDCHWMSLFTKGDRIALFDFEVAHLGNPDYQLAWIAASYYICMMEATVKNPMRATEIKDLTEQAFRNIVNSYHKWRRNPLAKSSEDMSSVIDFSTFMLFCGCTMFFFAVHGGGHRLISLTDEQKIQLLCLGAHLMLRSGDATCLDDVTTLLFHSFEEIKAE